MFPKTCQNSSNLYTLNLCSLYLQLMKLLDKSHEEMFSYIHAGNVKSDNLCLATYTKYD
jgi:hypothetical protein